MSKVKKKQPFAVKPSVPAACIELAEGSLTAGGLLYHLVCRSRKKTLKDENGSEGWIAFTIDQWCYLTGFTRHQYNDGLSRLKKGELVRSRRRKLTYKDPAAIAWLRITDKVKSGITEIIARPGITAFSEVPSIPISEETETVGAATSDNTDALIEMNITQNENKSKNVVIAETTTLEEANKKKKASQNKHTGKEVCQEGGVGFYETR